MFQQNINSQFYLVSFNFQRRHIVIRANDIPGLKTYLSTGESGLLKKLCPKFIILKFLVIFLVRIGTFLGMCSCTQCGYLCLPEAAAGQLEAEECSLDSP